MLSPRPEPTKLLLTAREAAEALSVTERTLWNWTASHGLPCVRIGRSLRYSVDELRKWIDSRTTRAPTDNETLPERLEPDEESLDRELGRVGRY